MPSDLPITLPAPRQMSVREYAACRLAIGDKVTRIGRMFWVRTKGAFYRPLLRFETYALEDADLPSTRFGGFQYAVPEERSANSTIAFLVLDALQGYSLESVGKKRRYLIKTAAKRYSVRPLVNIQEFTRDGYAPYLSFFARTGYRYKPERADREEFSTWARATFECSKAIVLGGYGPQGLVAISVSYWVDETLLYSTFFSDSAALRDGVGELMFHTLRESARRTKGIHQVFLRPYQDGNGMDQYYLMRGAKVVGKPAQLYLHPLAKCVLRVLSPSRYRLLRGCGVVSGSLPENASTTPGEAITVGQTRPTRTQSTPDTVAHP